MNNNIFVEPWIEEDIWNINDFKKIETPIYVVSEKKIEENLKILNRIQKETGCKILMALKSFSLFKLAPLVKKYLGGVEASSVNEARLGAKEFSGEVHVFSPSYTKKNIKDYMLYADHLVFNSFSQWNRFKDIVRGKNISCGLRVNLEHSESDVSIYDPSRPKSQFGVTIKNFEENNLEGIEGLHFHNLCELDADALKRSLDVFKDKFGRFLGEMKWVNFGGGH
ncbi:MAG: carboxynorspermidine decarboxylase, partial [Candidatus Pacebacteria bacterium]|nr:carboxynorspermidine decarboxylase [Candidatus Paceibacterota bacterium]